MPLAIYTLTNCDTCRQAVKWLRAKGLEFEEKPVRENPPSVAELRRMTTEYGGNFRKLFNTSGREYRDQKIGDRLSTMDQEAAIRLLAGNGSLVKRPFLIGDQVALVGFDETVWHSAFERQKV